MTEMSGAQAIAETGRAQPPATVKVWDPFVRVFHWTLIALILAAFATGEDAEQKHVMLGYAIVVIVGLRLAWGFVGPKPARFASFVKSPAETLRYLRETITMRAPRTFGHNPLGAMMILALIAAIGVVSWTGYLLTTDAWWGSEQLKEIHEASVYGLFALVAAHVAGVVWTSLEQRENLVLAMVTGRKRA